MLGCQTAGNPTTWLYFATRWQNPASKQAKTTAHVVWIPSRMQVHPPIRAQSCARPLAVCLNTSDVVLTLVPAGGTGFWSFFSQPDTSSVHDNSAVNTNNEFFVRFMVIVPCLVKDHQIFWTTSAMQLFSQLFYDPPPYTYMLPNGYSEMRAAHRASAKPLNFEKTLISYHLFRGILISNRCCITLCLCRQFVKLDAMIFAYW